MSSDTKREQGDRPFPWRCPNCRQREVVPQTIPYTIDVKHDGLMHNIHLPALTVPKCRSCGHLLFDDGADEQISSALRQHLRLLSPEQIRTNRKALALSQRELAERLGIAEETISRWETGALIQSRAMDNLLRIYFDNSDVRAGLVGGGQDASFGAEVNGISKPPSAASTNNSPTVRVSDADPIHKLEVHCRECSAWTKHKILTSVEWDNKEEDEDCWEAERYLTLECQGCGTVCFCLEFMCDGSTEEEDTLREVYPQRKRPMLPDISELPETVRAIYEETNKAFSNEQPILAGIGIRSILERVCSEKVQKDWNLKQKIDEMSTKGFITPNQANILHNLRIWANDAVHSTEAYTLQQLSAALFVVEHLLTSVYIVPKKANVLK